MTRAYTGASAALADWAGSLGWAEREAQAQQAKTTFSFYFLNPKLTKQPQIQNLNK
jgi:hypothetical protein